MNMTQFVNNVVERYFGSLLRPYFYAEVSVVDGDTVYIIRGGETEADATPYPYLAGYRPGVGDVVLCLKINGGRVIVLGEVVY